MAKLYVVSLSDAERLLLHKTIKKGKASARTTTRARILLKADAGPDGPEWTDTLSAEPAYSSRPATDPRDDLHAYCHAANARLEALTTANHAKAFAAKQAIIRELLTAVRVYPDGRIRIDGIVPAMTADQPSTIVNQIPASRIAPRVSL